MSLLGIQNDRGVFVVVLAGNSGGSYIQLLRAVNAAIVLWKMKESLDAFQLRPWLSVLTGP